MTLPTFWNRNGRAPIWAVNRLQCNLEKLFKELNEVESRPGSEFSPSCDFNEDKTSYFMEFDLPGVKKEDLKLELTGTHLTVSADCQSGQKGQPLSGIYQRTFMLPTDICFAATHLRHQRGACLVDGKTT